MTPGCKGCGTIIFGAQGWPRCLNPITKCASSLWYRSTVSEFVFPRLVQWSNALAPIPSDLITEVPSLANGSITQDPFTVTYHLNPKAVWFDGTPITCDDVAFTWEAILYTTGSLSTAGYTTAGGAAGISDVECGGGPAIVKLRFDKVYADWPDLFGGVAGFILEKAASPNERGSDKPDLAGEMHDSISFSGGPWFLKVWGTDQALLVRNDTYWGHRPLLDQVTFVPRSGMGTEAGSIVSGDVDAIAPEPSAAPFASQLSSRFAKQNVRAIEGGGDRVEALRLQMNQPPLNDPKVRQAFAYAMNRQAVVDRVERPNDANAHVDDCGPWVPGQGPWCSTPGPFARYAYDPATALNILRGDGFDCSGAANDHPCLKNGAPLVVTISIAAGSDRAVETASLLQQDALGGGVRCARDVLLGDRSGLHDPAAGSISGRSVSLRADRRSDGHRHLRLQPDPHGGKRLRRWELGPLVQQAGGTCSCRRATSFSIRRTGHR